MKTYLLEPRDPLVVRDGRPLQETGLMRSVSFPWPSTIAGALRTRAGLDRSGHFTSSPAQARKQQVIGPLLVELDDTGAVADWLVPAPRDCVLFSAPGTHTRHRLRPRATAPGEVTDAGAARFPAIVGEPPEGKPVPGPSFWHWKAVADWLRAPLDRDTIEPSALGEDGILTERRTHVAISKRTQTAADGQLFSTDGLRFTTAAGRRLALAARASCDVPDGVLPLGGERRPSMVRTIAGTLPQAPLDLKLSPDRLVRILLITPAIFQAGATPRNESLGQEVDLVTWTVPRPGVVSGWDFDRQSPKAIRRIVPAGSVYWARVKDDVDEKGFLAWVERMSMHCISDDAQDRLDGFGLCVVGVG